MDTAALDAQVRERREAEERERQAARVAAQASNSFETAVVLRAAAASQARRAQDQGVDAFRQQQ